MFIFDIKIPNLSWFFWALRKTSSLIPPTQEQEKQTNCNLKVFENYYQSSEIYQELTTKNQGGLIVDGRT